MALNQYNIHGEKYRYELLEDNTYGVFYWSKMFRRWMYLEHFTYHDSISTFLNLRNIVLEKDIYNLKQRDLEWILNSKPTCNVDCSLSVTFKVYKLRTDIYGLIVKRWNISSIGSLENITKMVREHLIGLRVARNEIYIS